jgi:hypothetical protein
MLNSIDVLNVKYSAHYGDADEGYRVSYDSTSNLIQYKKVDVLSSTNISQKKLADSEKKLLMDAIKESNFFETHIDEHSEDDGMVYHLSITLDENSNEVRWLSATPNTSKLDNLRETILSIAKA